jgi:uncharacterized SAM-binding protein YcdF (DUF218 family)
MFFLFSKILAFLLSPLTWILVLIIFAIFSKKPNRKRNFIIFAGIMFLLFSNNFLLNEALQKWEIMPVTLHKNDKFDFAIVLGGFSNFEPTNSRMQLNGAGDRIWQTLQLYKQKKVNKIFITGGSGKLLHQDITEADKVKTFLLTLQIPEKDIIVDALSRNTHENAENTMQWIKKHRPGASCILITSAAHIRRACGCFKKYDPSIVSYPVNLLSEPRKYDFDVLIVPNSQSLYEWDLLLKEMVGYYIYKFIGYY